MPWGARARPTVAGDLSHLVVRDSRGTKTDAYRPGGYPHKTSCGLFDRPKRVCEDETPDPCSFLDAVSDGGSEMNARIDARIAVLPGRIREARERARETSEGSAA